MQFHGDKFPNPAGLVEFLTDQRGQAKVKDNKIAIRRDWSHGRRPHHGRLMARSAIWPLRRRLLA